MGRISGKEHYREPARPQEVAGLALCDDSPVPESRRSRGPDPKDERCFGPEFIPTLRIAVADLSWLLSRGYPPKASLKLVGDRHALRDRQRQALGRCAASDQDRARRAAKELGPEALAGEIIAVDGYNVLLTLEAALCDGVLLVGRDGAIRDLSAMSRHYRRVHSTRPAIELMADFFLATGCAGVLCFLDRPVSNSGRLKGLIEEVVGDLSPSWSTELRDQTDRALIESPHVVATADSAILDRCGRWVNLARRIVAKSIPQARVLDLG